MKSRQIAVMYIGKCSHTEIICFDCTVAAVAEGRADMQGEIDRGNEIILTLQRLIARMEATTPRPVAAQELLNQEL